MRFLFVYQDYSKQARELLDKLGVNDVSLIVVRKDAQYPTDEEMQLLEAHRGADAAACEINRKYRKNVAPYVSFCCEPKKFRFEDQQLRGWLVPKSSVETSYAKPSEAFALACQKERRLVLHPNALACADEIAQHRWPFVTRSAELLVRYANGAIGGSLREVKSTHGVEFAVNGRVSFEYTVTFNGLTEEGRTEWHLKEGDRTTRESAARIYFSRVSFPSGLYLVVVFYVGPHPEDGRQKITFDVP
jgi:hypothetical protein